MIIPPKDSVFFSIDMEYADKVSTESGFELDLIICDAVSEDEDENKKSQGFNRALWHVREFGIVEAVPLALSKYFERIKMDLLVGDKIYFHFHTIGDHSRYEIDGKTFYVVDYSEIYCRVRDGKITMLNNYILVEPVLEPEENLRTPSGIWIKDKPDPIPNRAKIVHMNGEIEGVGVGEDIYFSRFSDCEIKIEGKKYSWMRKGDVLCKFVEA